MCGVVCARARAMIDVATDVRARFCSYPFAIDRTEFKDSPSPCMYLVGDYARVRLTRSVYIRRFCDVTG